MGLKDDSNAVRGAHSDKVVGLREGRELHERRHFIGPHRVLDREVATGREALRERDGLVARVVSRQHAVANVPVLYLVLKRSSPGWITIELYRTDHGLGSVSVVEGTGKLRRNYRVLLVEHGVLVKT